MFIGPITPTRQNIVHGASPPSVHESPVSNWTEADVQAWLKKIKLNDLCDEFDSFDGDHLQEWYNEFRRNPDKFEDDMKSQAGFQMNHKTYFKFKVALCKLFKN